MIHAKDMKAIVDTLIELKDILQIIQHEICVASVDGEYDCVFRVATTTQHADQILVELREFGYVARWCDDPGGNDLKTFEISWREI